MVQRFLRDESGMTMGLAIMLILLISVMGAGLLTLVSRDLNTVIEVNRGQKAFELADAGVGAAKRQLNSDCGSDPASCAVHYDGVGTDDFQWSEAQGGLTLRDLDGDGDPTDTVTVTIQPVDADRYKAISTGTYGSANRKIEAIFKTSGDGGGGGNIAYPATYASSDILISGGNVRINAMSMFTEGNIIFGGLTSRTDFANTYSGNNDLFDPMGNDELGDWDTIATRDPDEYWNTRGRRTKRANGTINEALPYRRPGFGAEGMLCGANVTTGVPNCDEVTDSIADGAWGYDSTTGPLAPDGVTPNPLPRGQRLTFVEKEPVNGEYPMNDPNTISMPFPKGAPPNPVRLKEYALDPDDDPETDDATYYKALDGDTFYEPDDPVTYLGWDDLIPTGNNEDVVFIDAQGQDLLYDGSTLTGARQGIIVSWCGNLEMRNATFTGIALSIYGDGNTGLPQGPSGEVSTSCGDDMGTLKTSNSDAASNRNSLLKAWLYANGGNSEAPGVEIGRNSNIFFLPSGNFDLLNLIAEITNPTTYSVEGWRECYQIEPAGECST